MLVVQLKRKRAYVSEMTVRSFRLILRTLPKIVDEDFDPSEAMTQSKDEIDHIAQQFITIKSAFGRVKKLSSLSESELYEIFMAFREVNPEIFDSPKTKVASPTSSKQSIGKIDTGVQGDVISNLDVSILTLSRLGYGDVLSMPYSLMTQAMVHAKKK